MSQQIYVTTPIYYVNGPPHIGHAYTTIVADAVARYHRVCGRRARLLTGTDEHGLKIQQKAHEQGMEPQALADQNSALFRSLWPKLMVYPDDNIRTTDRRHVEGVQKWWRACRASGDLYKGVYHGLYCVGCESYKTEKELVPGEEPRGLLCAIHHKPVVETEEETWFFRLSNYRDRLLRLYEEHPEFIQPEGRRQEIIAQVKDYLEDLSVSRKGITWGIPVPDDPEHVIYVWFDALFNYLTAVDTPDLKSFWPADVHFVAKDIVRFHAVYWPAFLMSVGRALPRTIWAHGYLLTGNRKIAKTDGVAVAQPGTKDPHILVEHLGSDALRYYLLREVALGQDGTFSIPGILQRTQNELGDTVGNLLHRTLPFVTKYFDGLIPAPVTSHVSDGLLESELEKLGEKVQDAWDAMAIHQALDHVLEMGRAANRYFDANTPWKWAKEGRLDRVATIVNVILRVLRLLAIELWPVTPHASQLILNQIGDGILMSNDDQHLLTGYWSYAMEGRVVYPAGPVFPRRTPEEEDRVLTALGVEIPPRKAPRRA